MSPQTAMGKLSITEIGVKKKLFVAWHCLGRTEGEGERPKVNCSWMGKGSVKGNSRQKGKKARVKGKMSAAGVDAQSPPSRGPDWRCQGMLRRNSRQSINPDYRDLQTSGREVRSVSGSQAYIFKQGSTMTAALNYSEGRGREAKEGEAVSPEHKVIRVPTKVAVWRTET